MILQVHDELLFEAPHEEMDRLRNWSEPKWKMRTRCRFHWLRI